MNMLVYLSATTLLVGCAPPPEDSNDAVTYQQDGTTMENPVANPTGDVSPDTDAVAAPTDAAGYLAAAAAGDLWEIRSSEALLARSKRADVRAFAQMMVTQHQQSTAKLTEAAKAENISAAAPTLNTDQQGMLAEIENAGPDQIDAVYLRHQRAAHALALATHRAYAEGGDNAALKRAASEIVPTVERHIARIDELSRAVPAVGG